MNTRALYWATKVIMEHLTALVFLCMVVVASVREEWIGLILCLGMVVLYQRDASRSLDKLKAEANRDTAFGLNGPARKQDLL